MAQERPTTEEIHDRVVNKRKELRKLSYADLLNQLYSVWHDGERREQHPLYKERTDDTCWDDHVLERACWDVMREWDDGKRGEAPEVQLTEKGYIEKVA